METDAAVCSLENNLNISDVINVMEREINVVHDMETQQRTLSRTAHGSGNTNAIGTSSTPYIKIVEQPASKALRFRYECEGRSAGSIPGVNSTPENKTYPTIQIIGYKGRAVVVVSCVTKDPPFRPHPHNLVGKEGCKKGICTLELNNDTMTASFSNLGIQCVKKKDIEDALKTREEIRVDPFRTGFSHRSQASSIDLNAVRLCFQAFLDGSERGKFNVLTPVVSEPIYDKKAMSDLIICKLSDSSASVVGGKEIILLCEKVAKEDIQVRFFEEIDDRIIWEGFGDFTPAHVHKQVAISFRTPRYKTIQVETPVKVSIQLRRPSDGATSDHLPFILTPLDTDPAYLKRKRQKFSNENMIRHLQDRSDLHNLQNPGMLKYNLDNAGLQVSIKSEPSASPTAGPVTNHPNILFVNSPVMMRNNSPSVYGGTSRTPSPFECPPGPTSNVSVATAAAYNNPSPLYTGVNDYASPMSTSHVPSLANPLPSPESSVRTVRSPPQGVPSISASVVNQCISVCGGNLVSVNQPQLLQQRSQQRQQRQTQMQQDHQQQMQPPPHLQGSTVLENVNFNYQEAATNMSPCDNRNAMNLQLKSEMTDVPNSMLMDMDNPQCSIELSLGRLDSRDLAELSMLDAGNLSENLSNCLNLNDTKPAMPKSSNTENMTDSLTNLANKTINDLCALNQMYQGQQN